MSPTYPSSQTQAQPGRTSTSAGVHQVTAQAGLHSRIAAQLPAIHRHVISEGTHPSRVECDAAILADAVPRLSSDMRLDMHLRRPCLDCQRLTRPGRSRCDDCTRAIRKGWDRGSVLNRQRRMRGAGGAAQRLRRKVNTQGGSSCMGCGAWHPAPSIRIDHVVTIGSGGTDQDDNVQPLCLSCHRIKTRQEQGGNHPDLDPYPSPSPSTSFTPSV